MSQIKEDLLAFQSINCAGLALTGQLNSNAELAKKSVDLFADGLKSTGKHSQRIKSHLPVISLVLKLISLLLYTTAILLDKNKPVASKVFSIALVGLMMAGCIAVFILAASNPMIVLGIGLGMIGAGFIIESVSFVRNWFKYRRCQKKLAHVALTPIEVIECDNMMLQKKRLEKKLDKLVYRLHILNLSLTSTTHEKERARKAVKQCQEELHHVSNKLTFYNNKEESIKKTISEQKKSYQHAKLGLYISLGSSLTAVAGLLLVPTLPLVGFLVITLGISFDIAGFYRHLKAKKRGYCKQKNATIDKIINENIQVINSIERIKRKSRFYTRSYADIISQLGESTMNINVSSGDGNINLYPKKCMPPNKYRKRVKPTVSVSEMPVHYHPFDNLR